MLSINFLINFIRRQLVDTKLAILETKELKDVSLSSNVAYGQVKVKSTVQADVYEDLGGGPPVYDTADK